MAPEVRHKLQQICNHNLRLQQKVEPQLQRLRDCVRMLPQLTQSPQIDWEQVGKDLAESPLQTSSQPTSATTPAKKGRRSTQRGGAVSQRDVEDLIIAALTEHHRYGQDNLNCKPIGIRELARKAGVGYGSVWRFFKKHFRSHKHYRNLCHRDLRNLLRRLRFLNGEYSAEEVLGDRAKLITDKGQLIRDDGRHEDE